MATFDLGLTIESVPKLLAGVGTTLELTAIGLFFGLILAILANLAFHTRAFSWLARSYVYFFRGTPLLVQLFVIYFGLPQAEFVRSGPWWVILREPFYCLCIALALNNGAYVAEIIRGGVLGVGHGMHDAAKALGLKPWQALYTIVAPIVLRLTLPAYGNEVISLMKCTALASTVTILDVTGIARSLVADTFAPYEIFLAAIAIYLAMTLVLQSAINRLGERLNRPLQR